ATLSRVLPAASLAYYLGAELVPAPEPVLRTGDSEHPLAGKAGFEQTVTDTLRRVFMLDAITRTEGLYPVQLHARERLEARLPFAPNFDRLYELPIADRVAAYLAPRFDPVEELLPEWHLATDLAPTGDAVRMLPYVADELSLVRTEGRREPLDVTGVPGELADFYRGAGDAGSEDPDRPRRRGSDEPGLAGTLLDEEVFTPVDVAARSLQWVGDGVPAGATKAIVESYQRRSDREPAPPEDHRISIGIVCNDPAMADEIGDAMYGSRDLLEFDVALHEEVTADELRELLQTPYDFLHYVGHTTPEGIQCAEDTVLDARTLDTVAVDSFFLNSCESYEQGRALVEGGSGAGVVTLSPVDDATATEAGHQFAKLLNAGFTFRSALAVLQEQSLLGHRYSVIGDGGLQLVQAAGGTPYYVSVARGRDPAEREVAVEYRPTLRRPIGSLVSLSLPAFDGHYLDLETVGPAPVSPESLRTFLALDEVPVLTEGTLRWSSEFDPTGDDPP
ncbi:MAG: CHAT domain-containing protein, partial [Halobacteriales archaeon]